MREKHRGNTAALLLGLLLLCGCGAAVETPVSAPVPEAAPPALAAEEPEDSYLLWPCFFSQTVDSGHHTLTLENPAENAVSIRVMVQDLDTGATLYQSGAIAPGAQEVWDIYTAYSSGVHTVEIRCTAPEADGMDNTLRQTIQLTLSQ